MGKILLVRHSAYSESVTVAVLYFCRNMLRNSSAYAKKLNQSCQHVLFEQQQLEEAASGTFLHAVVVC